VHHLEVPHHRAGRSAQRDHGAGVEVLPQPLPAEEIRAGAPDRDEHQVSRRVGRDHAPGVGGAGPVRGRPAPGVIARRATVPRHRVPAPTLAPAARVVGAHDAVGGVAAVVVADRGPDDHQVAHHRRRRGDLVLPGERRGVEQVAGEIDGAALAEVGAGFSGGAVERDEPRVHGAEVDPAAAGGSRGGAGVPPGGDPAVGEIAVVAVQVHAGVVGPAFGAGRRIERDHPAERSRDVQRPVHHQRGRLEAPAARQQIAGAVGPGEPQARDVGAGDLIERREAGAVGVAAVNRPAAGPLRPSPAGRVQETDADREDRPWVHGDQSREPIASTRAFTSRASSPG